MELHVQPLPFPHLLAAGVLGAPGEATALSMLTSLRWRDHAEAYYRLGIAADEEQSERAFEAAAIRQMVSDVRQAVHGAMRLDLSAQARLAVHRYDENAIIGFHTDLARRREVRFVLNLNAGWRPSDGGVWVLSKAPDLGRAVFLPPLTNTGFAFEVSAESFHALTRRSAGLSYAVVASFDVV
jgi:hypothetical protein